MVSFRPYLLNAEDMRRINLIRWYLSNIVWGAPDEWRWKAGPESRIAMVVEALFRELPNGSLRDPESPQELEAFQRSEQWPWYGVQGEAPEGESLPQLSMDYARQPVRTAGLSEPIDRPETAYDRKWSNTYREFRSAHAAFHGLVKATVAFVPFCGEQRICLAHPPPYTHSPRATQGPEVCVCVCVCVCVHGRGRGCVLARRCCMQLLFALACGELLDIPLCLSFRVRVCVCVA